MLGSWLGYVLYGMLSAMDRHDLKSKTEFFEHILADNKAHDLRLNDRDFKVGDLVVLHEWDAEHEEYTRRSLVRRITYITSSTSPCHFSPAALHEDFVILSIRPVV